MLTQKQVKWGFLAASAALLCMVGSTSPAQAGEQTVYVHVNDTATYMPPLKNGDREFGGNGPRVRISVGFFVVNNAVYRQIRMFAFEDNADRSGSMAAGTSAPKLVCTAPPGKTLKAVHGVKLDQPVLQKVMSGHGSYTEPRTPVGRVTVWGDRRGKDIGFHTRVAIKFDYRLPIVVSDQVPSRATARLPKSFTLVPNLIQGDADFQSNGPELAVHASLTHTDTVAYFSVSMSAVESAPGTTVAQAAKSVTIYRAPQGYRIKSILGGGRWHNMIKYTDRDLTPNYFNTPFGRVGVYGDRNGPDVGSYTRVVFENITRQAVIELERK